MLGVAKAKERSPLAIEVNAWVASLYGTCVILAPVSVSSFTAPICMDVALPEEPKVTSPAFAAATRSDTVFHGESALTASRKVASNNGAIGTKSLSGS
jgi:hypothetical protein